jgi:hypothetical protein
MVLFRLIQRPQLTDSPISSHVVTDGRLLLDIVHDRRNELIDSVHKGFFVDLKKKVQLMNHL